MTETYAQVLRRLLERQRARPRRGPVEPDDIDEDADNPQRAEEVSVPAPPTPPAPS